MGFTNSLSFVDSLRQQYEVDADKLLGLLMIEPLSGSSAVLL